MVVRHIRDRARVAQAIYNRPDIRERAQEIYQETLGLSVDDLVDLAGLRFRKFGTWDSAHSLAILWRMKPKAGKGHEVAA